MINLIAVTESVLDMQEGVDTRLMLLSDSLLLLMQAGFAVLTARFVCSKNTKEVLLNNVVDAYVGASASWLFRWAFSSGAYTDVSALVNR